VRNSRGGVRRAAVVVLTTLSAGAVALSSAEDAGAHHCQKPTELGNATVSVGGVGTVGVDQNNIGTTEHDVIVCADPPHQEAWFDVRDLDPGRIGVQIGLGTCGPFGCTGVGYTGAEASVPGASVDGALDGNNRIGASAGGGGGVCPWANGAPSACQLGGSTGHSTSGGDPGPPPSVHWSIDPFLAYWYYEALYAAPQYSRWCTDPMFWGWTWVDVAVWCGILLTNRLVSAPLGTLPAPMTDVNPTGSTSAAILAVSGTGNANGGLVAVSATGPASTGGGGVIAVSGTGNAYANGGLIAVSGTGDAYGATIANLSG
jgi:hypothetical protein